MIYSKRNATDRLLLYLTESKNFYIKRTKLRQGAKLTCLEFLSSVAVSVGFGRLPIQTTDISHKK